MTMLNLTERMKDRLILLLIDLISVSISFSIYFWIRVFSGIVVLPIRPDYVAPLIVIDVFWLTVFSLVGLYRPWHANSRLDEFIALFKAISYGCLFLFFIIFLDDTKAQTNLVSRFVIVIYWGVMTLFVGTGRMFYRSGRRRLLAAGVGLRNAIIVGWNPTARDLLDRLRLHPALGYHVVGFVKLDKRKTGTEYKGLRLLGSTEDIPSLIDRYSVRDILIALESSDHDKLLDVISHCNGHDVSLKILPDMYDIISGQARTNQIYGFPLIEIMPQIMQPWEQSMKRLTDVFVSLIVLIFLPPCGS